MTLSLSNPDRSFRPRNRALQRTHCFGGVALRTALGLGAVAAVGIGLWWSMGSETRESTGVIKGLARAAVQGPLTVSVVEKGSIEALNPVILTCQVEGRTRLIEILPEGTMVKPGDIVAKLDTSQLESERIDLEIKVENARAESVKERQDLAITKNQAEADIASAELDLELAQLDLNKYWSGEFPNELLATNNRIELAKAESKQAEDRVNGSEELFGKNYISKTELESDRIRYQRAAADIQKAQEDMRLLRKYSRVRTLRQMLSDIEQKALTLDRVQRRADANIIRAEAQLRADDGNLLRQTQLLAEVIEQLQYCLVRAPVAGSVVYAPPRSRRDPPLEAGQEVTENQRLIYLPSSGSDSAMLLQTAIHETYLDRVRVGQPAQVTIDSLTGRVYKGHVAFIASHPNKQESFLNPDLVVYDTHIHFDDSTDGLRSGMTGRVEILVDHFEDVVQVPVQSVVTRDSQQVVFVVNEQTGEQSPVPVQLGMDNQINVVIEEGLQAGQLVSLVPPLQPGQQQGTQNNTRDWNMDAVAQARDARINQQTAAARGDALAKLTPEQKLIVDALQKANEGDELAAFLPEFELQEAALDVLAVVGEGQSPIIGQDLRQAVELKLVIDALKSAQQRGFMERFIDNTSLVQEAETALVQAAIGNKPALSPLLTRTILTKLQQRAEAGGRGGPGGRPGGENWRRS